MKVVVSRPNNISVQINQPSQQSVTTTATFVGASSQGAQIQGAYNTANAALITAESAAANVGYAVNVATSAGNYANTALSEISVVYAFANTRYSANGGTVYGNMVITGNITPSTANVYTIGTPADPFQSVFVGPGSIHIDGIVLSNTSGSLSAKDPTGNSAQISGVFDGGIF